MKTINHKKRCRTQKTIESIMTHKLVTIKPDNSLRYIRKLFEKYKFHHLLVAEDGKLIGVVSDRDLLSELSPFLDTLSDHPRDKAALNKVAHQIMSRDPLTVNKETSIETACQLLLEKNISCLPVTNSQNYLEGILTWRDVFDALLGQRKYIR